MKKTLTVVAAAIAALTAFAPSAAGEPQPADVTLTCGAGQVPPGPPEKSGTVEVTPSPQSGQDQKVEQPVPSPCQAPGWPPGP